jgi:hypothetical protein
MKLPSIGRPGWYAIVAAVTMATGGWFSWSAHAEPLATLAAQIDTAQSNISTYRALIAKRAMFRREYTRLAGIYLAKQETSASVEAQFTDILSNIAQKDNVEFVGVTYGVVNGGNPPAPDPHIDSNGQRVTVPHDSPTSNTELVTNLGGRNAGDPATNRPDIPADAFIRIPAAVTFKGHWRNLLMATQDISRQQVLMSVSLPEVHRLDGDDLASSFSVQLLTPAITIEPEMLISTPRRPIVKAPRRTTSTPPSPSIRSAPHPSSKASLVPKPSSTKSAPEKKSPLTRLDRYRTST